MPYVFPDENLFMGGVALLIIALLFLRVRVTLRRRFLTSMDTRVETSTDSQKGTPPLV